MENNQIKEKYDRALQSFIQKVKCDKNIIALFSYGSIVDGSLWDKSDIDIWLISKENKKKIYNQYSLVEEDIDLQVELYSRIFFLELVDRPSSQNFFRSVMMSGHLHYSTDDTITNLFNRETQLGEIEKQESNLISSVYAVTCMKKIEKIINVNGDITILFNLMLKLIRYLSSIEIALHGKFIGREVEVQAMNINKDFFSDVYFNLINSELNIKSIEEKFIKCTKYIDNKVDIIFESIIKWFINEGDVRGASEINEYIKRKYNISNDGNELTDTYNFLSDKEILIKTTATIKLLENSKIFLEEAAYEYNFDY